MGTFVVAHNPDDESNLPFLIRLPVAGAPLLLKAKETWPRTSKVYCHRADAWPDHPDVVEEVAVRSCVRRGPAIDLVLARARENRSQLVFTQLKTGREAIFWQSARTTRKARPGIRVPTRRVAGWTELNVIVDTRERYPYRFARQQVVVTRKALRAGDYGVESPNGDVVAAVERKSLPDLTGDLVDGSLAFQLADLAAEWRAAVVVEERYSSLYKAERVKEGFLPDVLARLQVRYPTVPIVFCETRAFAEQWTYRFLGTALAEHTWENGDDDEPAGWPRLGKPG